MSLTSHSFQRQIRIPFSLEENSLGKLHLKNNITVFNLPPTNETAYMFSKKDVLDRRFDGLASYSKLQTDSPVVDFFSSPFTYEIDGIERTKIQLLIHEDMKQVFKENKQDNWDGYRAIGINDNQFKFAIEFMNKLFESDLDKHILEQVEINPENYGNIAFDWFVDHDHQISISIRENKAVFTYRSDEKKFYGEIPVDDKLDSIIDLIRSLYE